ncbi:MAG: lysophospholipid acyltransferase family protein [Polyangia bacterium]
MPPDESQQKNGASLFRWLTVGVASFGGWAAANLLLLAALPLLALVALIGRRRGAIALRRFGSWFLRLFFVRYLSAVRLLRFAELPDPESTGDARPRLYVANHRSWIDALLALALFPGVRVPVGAGYLRVPLLGTLIRWSGSIPVDTASAASALEGIGRARRALEEGDSLFAFPEGRRAAGRRPLPFSDVFFRVAIETGAPIVPVVLHSDEPYLAPGPGSWLPRRRATWRIRVLEESTPDPRDRPADLGRRARKLLADQLAELDPPERTR